MGYEGIKLLMTLGVQPVGDWASAAPKTKQSAYKKILSRAAFKIATFENISMNNSHNDFVPIGS